MHLSFALAAVLWLPAKTKLEEPSPPAAARATLKVSGLGWLRSRELRLSLLVLLGSQRGATMDANAIEDAAVILVSALHEEGFQKAEIEIEATLVDGTVERHLFDQSLASSLPRTLRARAVEFHLIPGVRWHVDSVEIAGLSTLGGKSMRSFFRTDEMLFVMAKTNAYSPSRIKSSANVLLGALHRRGYADASVSARVAKVDEKSGAVALRVEVNEGHQWRLVALRYESGGIPIAPLTTAKKWIGRPWSPSLQEDLKMETLRAYYKQGYPDVGVRIVPERAEAKNGMQPVTALVKIQTGNSVRVDQLRFRGNLITRERTLRRSARVQAGDPLNPLALAEARYRISRLGVFDAVDLAYEPKEGAVRDPVFTLKESQRREASLLFGYGSYEQLRAGIEFRQQNLFGRAHQSRIQFVQSMKSSSGDYTYSVPELFGESIDGAMKLFALQRKEIAFTRQESGVDFTLKRPLPWLKAEMTAGYTFQNLRNKNSELATKATDEEQLSVSSLNFGLTGDHRDNPLRPRDGYRWFTQIELATRSLGGEAEYQRLELGAAYHFKCGRGHWIHLGLVHGVITTLGTSDTDLPVNKRFFPGGDNSIRGYQKGEAAPRGADGLFIGAKSYVLFNFELEQALTTNWSLVVMADALGTAARLKSYPFSERLYTVGLGLRYQTLIGPIRIEYGHNLNPRSEDPRGTWLISIGYPF
jgi:outer membrane protein assembly complex protein YaeT